MPTGKKDSTRDSVVVVESLFTRNTPTSVNQATGRVYTAAEIIGGIIVRNGAGSAVTDTMPTAALLVQAMGINTRIGDVIELLLVNGSATAPEVVTIAAGAGGSFDAAQGATSRVVPQNASKIIRIRITNNVVGSEAYVVYC